MRLKSCLAIGGMDTRNRDLIKALARVDESLADGEASSLRTYRQTTGRDGWDVLGLALDHLEVLGLKDEVRHDGSMSFEFESALRAHVATHCGPIEGEIAVPTETGPMTLLHVTPTPDRPFHTLVTSGLSAQPMAVPPEETEVPRFAELMLLLPFDWPVEAAAAHNSPEVWPLRVLASNAAFPAKYEAWLGAGHTLPNGEPPARFVPNLDFCGVLIAPPMSLHPEDRSFVRQDGERVTLYAVLPVFERELELKRKEGTSALFDRFDAAAVNELLDVERDSLAGTLIEILKRKQD